MVNYYDILGLSLYEDNQDAILSAYRNGTNKIKEKIIDNNGLSNKLIEINEAFLVLSDLDLKKKYDYSLTASKVDDSLAIAIKEKRDKAERFVQSKMELVPKKRKKNKWPAIICGIFLFSALGSIMRVCTQTIVENGSAPSVEINNYYEPTDWKRHIISNSFSIAVPRTMEKRIDLSEYNVASAFQQYGLEENLPGSAETYCRVLIQYDSFADGEVERHNQTSYITVEDRKAFREMCDVEVEPWSYIVQPSFRWIDINGTKALEASYQRTGEDGPVNCHLYLLPNYNEMAKIIVAYREIDSDKWEADMNNVIRTFRWNNPK